MQSSLFDTADREQHVSIPLIAREMSGVCDWWCPLPSAVSAQPTWQPLPGFRLIQVCGQKVECESMARADQDSEAAANPPHRFPSPNPPH